MKHLGCNLWVAETARGGVDTYFRWTVLRGDGTKIGNVCAATRTARRWWEPGTKEHLNGHELGLLAQFMREGEKE